MRKIPGVVFLSVIRPEGNSKAKILVLCLENILGLINSRHQKIIELEVDFPSLAVKFN